MFKLVYDVNGDNVVYGYANNAVELTILCDNAIEDGIWFFSIVKT